VLLDFKSCVADCDKALNLDPKYTKALHRRAKANFEMGNYDLAVKDFQEVMTLDPNNSEVLILEHIPSFFSFLTLSFFFIFKYKENILKF